MGKGQVYIFDCDSRTSVVGLSLVQCAECPAHGMTRFGTCGAQLGPLRCMRFCTPLFILFYDTCAGSSTKETSTEEVDGDKLISFKASAPSQEERPPAVYLYIIQT